MGAGNSGGDVLYTAPEPDICYMPEVGNGFIGTVIGWDALFLPGPAFDNPAADLAAQPAQLVRLRLGFQY